MERKESNRHLAAILFTDIVGYTAMMQRDEHLALQLVRRHQQVLEKRIPEHHGEIYQYYGDGSMSMFNSAIQAVQCAFEIQKELLQEPVVHIRIGIHIGEIYTEGGKVFGDGVNIASRIESIGQGGTVLFSRDVFEKVRNNTGFQIKSIGKFEFKNVEDPVEVFALTNPEIVTPDLKSIDGKLKPKAPKRKWTVEYVLSGVILVLVAGYFLALRPGANSKSDENVMQHRSIAVLPFESISEGVDETFLSTGLAEDILTQLAQIRDLKVISRSSSMRYKDSGKPLKTIANELGVTSILEGSVRKYGNNLRVSVQLIDGMNESLIWAADFDRQIEDVLNVQRDVALAVSENLKIALTPEIKNRLEKTGNVNPAAYVNYQRGQDILRQSSGTKAEMDDAIRYFETAIQQDSTFTQAWVGMADAWLVSVYWHRVTSEMAIPKAREALMQALKLDPGIGEAFGLLGAINQAERDPVSAEKNLSKSIELNPNYAISYERLAWVRLHKNNDEKGAFILLNKAMQLDPLSTRFKGSFATMCYFIRRFDEGIRFIEENLEKEPTDNYLLWALAYLQTGKGEYEKAIQSLLKRSIGLTTNWVLGYCYAKTGRVDEARTILQNNLIKRKNEPVPDYMLAVQYAALGEKKKALEHLRLSIYSDGEGFFVLGISDDPMLSTLRGEPELQEILQEVKKAYTK